MILVPGLDHIITRYDGTVPYFMWSRPRKNSDMVSQLLWHWLKHFSITVLKFPASPLGTCPSERPAMSLTYKWHLGSLVTLCGFVGSSLMLVHKQELHLHHSHWYTGTRDNLAKKHPLVAWFWRRGSLSLYWMLYINSKQDIHCDVKCRCWSLCVLL